MRWLMMVTMMFAGTALAESSKIAVVDMERALFLSNAAKASIKQFEKDNKSEIDKLKGLEKKLRTLKEKLEKNADVMSDEERRKATSNFETQSTEFKFFARQLQQTEQTWKREFFQKQLPALEKKLKTIIDEGGYDVVLQAGAAIYASPKVDVTKLLLERLNKK